MDTDRERSQTFWQHLTELRNRLFFAFLAIVIAAVAVGYFWELVFALLKAPLLLALPDVKLNFLSPTEPFFLMMKISIFGGLIIAAPVVIWQIWAFIAPGLKPAERRKVIPVLPVIFLLFLGGVAFVYFLLLPLSLKFLLEFAPEGLEAELTIDRYFKFIMGLTISGGLMFELPAVLAVLGALGLVSAKKLLKQTGTALVVLMIVAAIITPTGDMFNMLAFTAPLMVLYFLGILTVWLIQLRRNKKTPEASEEE